MFSFKIILKKWCVLAILTSCKDLKNWDSRYDTTLNIKFQPAMDPLVPTVCQELHSKKLEALPFSKVLLKDNQKAELFYLSQTLPIPLIPDGNRVSFFLTDDASYYYHKVTIHYDRIISLISPEAGGLQQKYVIKDIVFTNKADKRSIFKTFTIEHAVPLKIEKATQTQHVTIYY